MIIIKIFTVWLLVTHGIMQGLFAIFIAYWGNRIHKIKWLCGMVIFQSVASMIVIIPTLTHQRYFNCLNNYEINKVKPKK